MDSPSISSLTGWSASATSSSSSVRLTPRPTSGRSEASLRACRYQRVARGEHRRQLRPLTRARRTASTANAPQPGRRSRSPTAPVPGCVSSPAGSMSQPRCVSISSAAASRACWACVSWSADGLASPRRRASSSTVAYAIRAQPFLPFLALGSSFLVSFWPSVFRAAGGLGWPPVPSSHGAEPSGRTTCWFGRVVRARPSGDRDLLDAGGLHDQLREVAGVRDLHAEHRRLDDLERADAVLVDLGRRAWRGRAGSWRRRTRRRRRR